MAPTGRLALAAAGIQKIAPHIAVDDSSGFTKKTNLQI
jgi:hypothetical protein